MVLMHVVKDAENQRPLPAVWRPVFQAVVTALVSGDYRLSTPIPGLRPLSAETAEAIRDYIQEYGETLIALPEATWDSSICLWMGDYWDVLVDLWTLGEGRSDLVLQARVRESGSGYVYEVEGVYVP